MTKYYVSTLMDASRGMMYLNSGGSSLCFLRLKSFQIKSVGSKKLWALLQTWIKSWPSLDFRLLTRTKNSRRYWNSKRMKAGDDMDKILRDLISLKEIIVQQRSRITLREHHSLLNMYVCMCRWMFPAHDSHLKALGRLGSAIGANSSLSDL